MTLASRDLVDSVVSLASRAGRRGGARVVGINGPQGCGKSTLAAAVVVAARAAGEAAVALSIDDFYLTHAAQEALAAGHPGNRYLEHRGYPGTHDVALGESTLRALRAAAPGEHVALPTYDKSAHRGRGDRHPRAAWPRVAGPVDLVVLEGWMLGFEPVARGVAEAMIDRDLAVAASYVPPYGAWTRELDAFVMLEASGAEDVVRWRVDAERARRASGAAALTDDEARDYVERFLPAYALWAPTLRPPTRAGTPIPALRVRLAPDRRPVALEVAS